MKNFSVNRVEPDSEDKLLPSLIINDNGKHFATIWADASITFNPQKDYFVDDLKYLLKISEMFYTFYNNVKTPQNEKVT